MPPFPPARERRLAAGIHLAGIATGPLAAMAGALLWGRHATPWLRRHVRDAFIHWAIATTLFVGALALDTANPLYDFSAIRLAAADLGAYFSLARNTAALAWGASIPFAIASARRATQGKGPLYPFTLWWRAPLHEPPSL